MALTGEWKHFGGPQPAAPQDSTTGGHAYGCTRTFALPFSAAAAAESPLRSPALGLASDAGLAERLLPRFRGDLQDKQAMCSTLRAMAPSWRPRLLLHVLWGAVI